MPWANFTDAEVRRQPADETDLSGTLADTDLGTTGLVTC